MAAQPPSAVDAILTDIGWLAAADEFADATILNIREGSDDSKASTVGRDRWVVEIMRELGSKSSWRPIDVQDVIMAGGLSGRNVSAGEDAFAEDMSVFVELFALLDGRIDS